MKIFKHLLVSGLLSITLLVSACAGLTRSDKPALRTWWLTPTTDGLRQVAAPSVLLLSVRVTVVPGLDTDRILTLSDDAQLNHYAAARWSANLPELISSLTARSLQASGHFELVSDRVGNANEDCDLQLELREFFARTGASGKAFEVSIDIDGQHRCAENKSKPVKMRVSIPVQDDTMEAVVTAYQQGVDEIMQALLQQLVL